MDISFLFPRRVDSAVAGLEEAKNPAGKILRLIQDRLSAAEFGKNLANLSNQFAVSANHGFEFQKRSQLFIRVHNETLSVVAMRVNNPDRSPSESIAETQPQHQPALLSHAEISCETEETDQGAAKLQPAGRLGPKAPPKCT